MKLRSRFALLFLVTALTLSLFSTQVIAASDFSDINGHWAEDAVLALMDQGVITGYPDGTYKPDREVTRAEFAKILSLAYDIQPKSASGFSDVKASHWAAGYIGALSEKGIIQGYPDKTFKPNSKITRAEAVTMLARVLDLLNSDETQPDWVQSFADVDPDHWAYIPVELGQRLHILPSQWTEYFKPGRNTTRAEIAYMVHGSTDFEVTKGTVSSVDTNTNTLIIRPVVGDRQLFMLPSDAIVLRNGSLIGLEAFRQGDQVHILSEKAGDARYVKAMGILTQDDVSNKVSTLTEGLLGPEQIRAIIAGDWDALGSSMKYNLYNRLTEMGASAQEAESLLNQDWKSMSTLGQERVAAALSDAVGVSPEMTQSLLNQDWKKAQDLAQIELTEKLLSKLMF